MRARSPARRRSHVSPATARVGMPGSGPNAMGSPCPKRGEDCVPTCVVYGLPALTQAPFARGAPPCPEVHRYPARPQRLSRTAEGPTSDWQGTAAPAHPGRAPPAPGCGAPAQIQPVSPHAPGGRTRAGLWGSAGLPSAYRVPRATGPSSPPHRPRRAHCSGSQGPPLPEQRPVHKASPCRMAFMARDPAAAGQPGRSSADVPLTVAH